MQKNNIVLYFLNYIIEGQSNKTYQEKFIKIWAEALRKKELRNMIRWLDESENVIHILTTRRPSFWVVILGFPRLKWISCANFCPFLSKIILCNAYIQKEQRGYKKEKKLHTHILFTRSSLRFHFEI